MQDTIEGEEIELVNTKANIVRGARVKIGEGCDIGIVEYSESLERDKDAKIREEKKA